MPTLYESIEQTQRNVGTEGTILSEDVIGRKLSIFSALGHFPQVLLHECTVSLRDPTHGVCSHINKSRVRFDKKKNACVMRDVHAICVQCLLPNHPY